MCCLVKAVERDTGSGNCAWSKGGDRDSSAKEEIEGKPAPVSLHLP
jgi:hypothetical protein